MFLELLRVQWTRWSFSNLPRVLWLTLNIDRHTATVKTPPAPPPHPLSKKFNRFESTRSSSAADFLPLTRLLAFPLPICLHFVFMNSRALAGNWNSTVNGSMTRNPKRSTSIFLGLRPPFGLDATNEFLPPKSSAPEGLAAYLNQ
jgi:hypothetical protein